MSFLYKNVAAQDVDEFRIRKGVENGSGKPVYIVEIKTSSGGWSQVYHTNVSIAEAKKWIGNSGKIVSLPSTDSCGEDAAEFKVGDKVKESFWGDGWKVKRVGGKNEKGEQLYVCENNLHSELVFNEKNMKHAADSAAMDDLNDGIKTIENKARALIADAKNARSKYAEILARSEIAKNNAQVKKTFEDDIARCDKLINALKAI